MGLGFSVVAKPAAFMLTMNLEAAGAKTVNTSDSLSLAYNQWNECNSCVPALRRLEIFASAGGILQDSDTPLHHVYVCAPAARTNTG